MKEICIYSLVKHCWLYQTGGSKEQLGEDQRKRVIKKMVCWGNAGGMERKLKAATPY
jgi:hypothetical protein